MDHSDTATAHLYVEADLAMKEETLRPVTDPSPKPTRFHADDRLSAFLKTV